MTTELGPGLPGRRRIPPSGESFGEERPRLPPGDVRPVGPVPPDADDPGRRRRRFLLVRMALLLTVVLLGSGAVALLHAGAWGLALVCGGPAMVLNVGMVVSILLTRKLVAVTVRGMSMQPTYHDGDRVLVRRNVRPAAGQVVVVERPTVGAEWYTPPVPPAAGAVAVTGREWMIKRVAAVPGDPIPRHRIPALTDAPELRVPPGKLVLFGDNQEASFDSRYVGYFPAARVLGTVRRSLSRRGGMGRVGRSGHKIAIMTSSESACDDHSQGGPPIAAVRQRGGVSSL